MKKANYKYTKKLFKFCTNHDISICELGAEFFNWTRNNFSRCKGGYYCFTKEQLLNFKKFYLKHLKLVIAQLERDIQEET